MSDAFPARAPALTHVIDYESKGSPQFNAFFKKQGTLTIDPEGPTYRFTGARRATFADDPVEMTFDATEIWNVVADDRQISFRGRATGTSAPAKPFLFYAADAESAAAIVSLLPRRFDADFIAERTFAHRVQQLPRVAHPAQSVTNLVVAANLGVFVLMGALGAGWLQVENMMPYIVYGANNGMATTGGEWWRLLTSMFMHYGILHLGFNMWALFEAGHFLERLQGRALYALTYFASGLGGGFASILWNGDQKWSAGASGAVFGVYGAILGYALRKKRGIPRTFFKALLRSSLMFAGYNIFFGLAMPQIDNSAHLGGALTGLVFGALLALPLDLEQRARQWKSRLALGLAALTAVVAIGVATTPRYSYHIREELAFDAANNRFEPRETELLRVHTAALKAIIAGADGTSHAAWIEAELVPFYAEWQRALRAVAPLRPELDTYQRQQMTVRYFEKFDVILRTLATELRAKDPLAISHYNTAVAQAGEEIARFNAAAKDSR